MRVLLASGLATAALTCSTLAPVDTPDGCSVDADCKEAGFVCGGEGLCYAAEFPPRALIGLDVRGGGLAKAIRVELRGEDSAVLRIDRSPLRYSVSLDDRDDGPGVRDQLRISLHETYASGDDKTTIELAGAVTLSQDSRLARESVTSPSRDIALVDAMGKPIEGPRLELPWARYDRDPLGNDIPLLLRINATDALDEGSQIFVYRGPVYRQIVRPQLAGVGVYDFAIQTRRECHRKVRGSVVVGADNTPVSGVNVEFRHIGRDPADGPICDPQPEEGSPAVCSPRTIAALDGLPECITVNDCPAPYGCHATGDDDGSKRCGCDRDSQCPSRQVCDLESQRCALNLDKLVAARGSTVDDTNDYDAWFYTYCDDDLEADPEMNFLVTATPGGGGQGTVPSMTYTTVIDFPWQNGLYPPRDAQQICMPDWAPSQPVGLTLAGAPQALYVDNDERPWTCCSPTCLDTKSGMPPTAPASCPVAATATAHAMFTPDPALWKQYSCMELAATDSTVPAGSQRVPYGPFDLASCSQLGKPCEISLSPGTPAGPGLEYELRLEPAVGSLIRSMAFPPTLIDAATTTVTPPKLEYRVLLRGRVELAPELAMEGEDTTISCPLRADIMAERLRMPEEAGTTVLGPHFYIGHTIPGSIFCEFVLPVNPGVYAVTALTQSGSRGGPAKIKVFDLRLGSPLVDSTGLMPVADLPAPIVMEAGTLVTLELDNFDRSTVAVPLDLAGWKPIEGHPELDLNAPDTCHGPTGRGCEIRRLRAKGGGLALTQEQYVKYLTRVPAK